MNVVFLEDFIELGWLHYATFGKHYVGGWAKSDALYCVARAYRRGGDRFHASYLCHEAQHYSDYKRFPKLQQQDLEYRAKLAELIASKRPGKLIKKFSSEAKDNKQLPHSYAAFCLLKNFEQRRLDPRSIKRSAVASLSAHSKALRERGARTVKSVLPYASLHHKLLGRLAVHATDSSASTGKGPMPYLLCDDIHKTIADLKGKGVRVSEPMREGESPWFAGFQDLDGNLWGIEEM